MDKCLTWLLPVASLSGLLFFMPAQAAPTTSDPVSRVDLTSQTQLAYYCQWRRVCSTRCVERAGRGYCVRWDYVCSNVCDGGGYGPYYYHHWRRGYWW